MFTIAGDASASDNRASPFSAGVGAIAATASTAAAKRNIRPPEAEKRTAFGLFSSYVALFRWYTRTGMIYYLPTRAATRAEAQKATYLPRKGG